MIRAVLDTNVLVSALLSSSGPPARLIAWWLEGRFELLVSPRVLEELREVLARPKIRGRVAASDAEGFVHLLSRFAVQEDDPRRPARLTPDRGDDYLVALARASGATVLVSGDRHLLELEEPDPPVVTPRDFLDALGE